MIDSNKLRSGQTFMIKNDIFICLDVSHNKTARAAANIKVKMKNLRTGSITTETFGSNDKFSKANISTVKMQYLYAQGANIVFMNQETYEQIEIEKNRIEWELNFIKENSDVDVIMFENEVLGVKLVPKVKLKVIEAEEAVKGDTSTNVQIKVKLETGLELQTPAFIKEGEVIEVSTVDGSYSSRG